LPDTVGQGDIEIGDGFGTSVTGPVANANQTTDTKNTVNLNVKTDGGIIIDENNQIEINWEAFVSDGDINIIGFGEIEVHSPTTPNANQDCDTDTTVKLSAAFLERITKLEARIAVLEARP